MFINKPFKPISELTAKVTKDNNAIIRIFKVFKRIKSKIFKNLCVLKYTQSFIL